VKTAVEIAGWAVLCLPLLVLLVREMCASPQPAEDEPADPRAWIDDRIRAETNSARRTAWRMIRDHDLENL
jgi:uncharacterized MAPEG superfamily protein